MDLWAVHPLCDTHSTTPNGALLNLDVVIVVAIWVQWTNIKEKKFEIEADIWRYTVEVAWLLGKVVIKGWSWFGTILR